MEKPEMTFNIRSKEKVILCINGWENQIWSVSKKTVTSQNLIPGTSRDITGYNKEQELSFCTKLDGVSAFVNIRREFV